MVFKIALNFSFNWGPTLNSQKRKLYFFYRQVKLIWIKNEYILVKELFIIPKNMEYIIIKNI